MPRKYPETKAKTTKTSITTTTNTGRTTTTKNNAEEKPKRGRGRPPKRKSAPKTVEPTKITSSSGIEVISKNRKPVAVALFGVRMYEVNAKGKWAVASDLVKGRAPMLKTQPSDPKNKAFWAAQILVGVPDDDAVALPGIIAARDAANK